MSKKIIKVVFGKDPNHVSAGGVKSTLTRRVGHAEYTEKAYEYIAPEGATGREDYAVVCSSDSCVNASTMKIVRIVEWIDADKCTHSGAHRPAMVVFSTGDYKSYVARLEAKADLLRKIEEKLSERSKIAQLELLAGDDEDAKALLAAYKELG